MRILYLADLLWPYIGGPEVLSAALLPEMVRRGHDVLAVTSHGDRVLPDEDELDGVRIVRLPFRKAAESDGARAVGDMVRRLSAIKRGFAPDIVHVGAVGATTLFHLQSSRVAPAPTLATIQTQLRSMDSDTAVFRLLQSAHWVRFVSHRLLESTCAQMPELRARSSVIYSFFPGSFDEAQPLPFAPPRLVCLSRLIADKNLTLAIEALAAVRANHGGLRLLVAGEGPERQRLGRHAEELGVADSVEFLGWVEPAAVPPLLDRCTVLILPSLREGLPTAAIAAAMMGRPVVATRVGSMDEVVVHEETGLLVDPSVTPMSEAIRRLLGNPERASMMGARGRERARVLFDQRGCMDAFEALYERVRIS